MALSQKKNDAKTIERSRIALSSYKTNPEINLGLSDYGYDETTVDGGWQLHAKADTAFKANQTETIETNLVSEDYKKAYKKRASVFKKHRNMASIFFKRSPEVLMELNVKGRFPSNYIAFFNAHELFYSAIKNNADIQAQFDRIKITAPVIGDCEAELAILKNKRADYDREFGESQAATQEKNESIEELREWMEDFDAMAKIALWNQPQLLESLGIFVRN